MKPIIETLIVMTLIIAGMVLGFYFGYQIANDQNEVTGNKIDGMWLKGMENKTEAENYVQEKDKGGDWICVNIKGMTYKRMIEVCNHEAGHEIFAENCEKNIDKCLEITENAK
jgi:hypothetical protein